MANETLEDDLFDFLCHKYVQRQDDRQVQMNLQYTTAETHDLARTLAAYFIGRVDASIEKARAIYDDKGRMESLRARAANLGVTVRQRSSSDRHFGGMWFGRIARYGQMSEEIGPCHTEDQALVTTMAQAERSIDG